MCTDTLTGNRRFKAKNRLFKSPLLVLQVEVHRVGWEWDNEPSYPTGRDVNHKFWRDARLEDITN